MSKPYSSILDSFLDLEGREPDYNDAGLKDALESGEAVLDRTHAHADDILDALTSGKGKSASNPYERRIAEKEASAPMVAAVKGDWRNKDYENELSDDDSILNDVATTFAKAEGASVEKKELSDNEVKSYIKQLLNNGVAPAKVAAQLNKLAELSVFNRTMSNDYLNRNAGLLGMAYIEPNAYMSKCSSTFNEMQRRGGNPRAKSAKQISACEGCANFKRNGNQKTCSLYKLPLVANQTELAAVVNKMTAGVPAKSKKAALVQIANRTDEHVAPTQFERKTESPVGRTAGFSHERTAGAGTIEKQQSLSGNHILKLHTQGHSMVSIYKAASQRFGAFETGKAIREFIGSLKKQDGHIVLAKADAQFLSKLGLKNVKGAAKCASCKHHTAKEAAKVAAQNAEVTERMVSRTQDNFVQQTPAHARTTQKKAAEPTFTTMDVEKMFKAAQSLEKIYHFGSAKVGSAKAASAVKSFVGSLKSKGTKVALSQVDCQFLKGKLATNNPIIGASKCGSCSYRKGMHCGLTGGTLLTFPGMDKQASTHKVAADAPKDGYAMLNEFELSAAAPTQDIEMSAPDRAEVEMGNTMTAGEIE